MERISVNWISGIDPDDPHAVRAALIRAAESEGERLVIVARDAAQKARLEYLEAHRQLKIVNRLEEKAKTMHRLENNKAEQAEIDELAGQRRLQPFALSL